MEWQHIKAVIFDVDGTLYTQGKLRRKMLVALLSHYALRPWRLRDMLILRRFRHEREKNLAYAGPDLEADQYAWCADNRPAAIPAIREVVGRWMFEHPNRYLRGCMYPGIGEFFAVLRARRIPIGIYSDYPAHAKLAAMGLKADVVISSTDAAVNRLKPNPRGLLLMAEELGLAPEECLFIGDRPELDGECARRAHMPFLLVEQKPLPEFDFYHGLTRQLRATKTTTSHEPDPCTLQR
ncbi:HAD family hydrolase [Hymenobacter edaphi]|uniref:phosphoglycolate phosphatase n=1 Tax=Hymenobacter edaphi TaxID=2211146 RepID=A0A328BT52_9BACT|nr:HAD family hydrolase [Hymenobacter edaphi]RAK69855.1 HAD family hydrolase [Hymenobacter edaphi]